MQIRIEDEASKTFEMMPVLIFTTIFPIVIGMFLRLPKLILEIKDKKQWTFDWIKFIAIGIPAIYITMIPLLATTSFGMNLLFYTEVIFFGKTTLITTAGIVFGYVLLDSLKKV